MLGVRTYAKGYIDACRSRVNADVAAYRKVAAAAKKQAAAFEATFFSNLVLALDHSFAHRLRTVEGKDGNPLNEVRMLADSIMENKGVLKADKTIKYTPERSVLQLKPGDKIGLDEAGFGRLADAFLAEVAKKYR